MTLENIAELYENMLTRMYLRVSAICLLLAIAASVIILSFVPLSGFAVFQIIGLCLICLTIASALIQHKKKSCFKKISDMLSLHALTLDELKVTIDANAFRYELSSKELENRTVTASPPPPSKPSLP